MNYSRIYDELISNAIQRNTTTFSIGEVEKHHIIPKCMGGTDATENLVVLTIREHIIAHALLGKIYGGKLWFAAMAMHMGRENYKNSRTLALIRSEAHIAISERMKGNQNGSYVWSDERKEIHKKAMSKVGFSRAKHIALEKAWATNRGSAQSAESNAKRSKTMKTNNFVPIKAGDFETCSKAGKANKSVKKSFRTEEHSNNWRASALSKYPHWQFKDELFELWLRFNKPKCGRFTRIAIEHGYPSAHYGKMVAGFLETAMGLN